MEQSSQMTTKRRFNVGLIGVGQGGTSLAMTMAKTLGVDSSVLSSINLSDSDLKKAALVPEQNRIPLDRDSFGAGKQRDVSRNYAMSQKEYVLSKLTEIYTGKGVNVYFVCFSLDGGTGSGYGPFLTALLESDAFTAKSNTDIVIGMPILPAQNAGKDALNNTISAMKEISNLSQKKLARFMLVNNEYLSAELEGKDVDDETRWASVNAAVSKMIKRYLFTSYLSNTSNLDMQDRWSALVTAGCHALFTYDKIKRDDGEYDYEIRGPFILPEGARVDKMACEIPSGESRVRDSLVNGIGCTVTEGGMAGYYDPSEEGATPVIHLAGYSNLSKIAERYQNRFNQIKQRSEAAAATDRQGLGFSSINSNKSWIESQETTKRSASAQDIFNALSGE